MPRSAMAVEGNIGAQVLLNGALPGPLQEVPMAELFAFYLAVRHSRPDEKASSYSTVTACGSSIPTTRAGPTAPRQDM